MSETTDAGLRYSVNGAVATITLDRPERKNAFTLETIDAWVDALHAAAEDDAVRVVVLAATGDVFCAGIDLGAFADVDPTPLARKEVLSKRIHRVALALDDLDKPTIASVNGAAVGAGMDMALLCDMRIAARSARFSEAYIKVGLVPGDGGAWLLPRLVGPGKAMELLLTGAWVDSAEAERIGLVNSVVEDEDLAEATSALATRIAGGPPVQVAMIRRLVRQSGSIDLRTHFDLVSSHAGIVGAINDAARAADA